MAVEVFSWPSLHKRMGIELGVACMPNEHTSDWATAPNSVWSESLLSTRRKLVPLATHWVHSEDSDQTRQMPRLICLHWEHIPLCWFCSEAAHFVQLCQPELYKTCNCRNQKNKTQTENKQNKTIKQKLNKKKKKKRQVIKILKSHLFHISYLCPDTRVCLLSLVLHLKVRTQTTRIFNGCEVRTENSVQGVTVRPHKACRVTPNSYPECGIFNSHQTTIMDSFSCTLFLQRLY